MRGRTLTDTGAGPTAGWRSAAVGGVALWLCVRLVVSLIGIVTGALRSGPSVTDRAAARTLDSAGDGFVAVLHHWDSGYFLTIARDGYFSDGAFAGLPSFFPGYPLAARAVSWLVSAGHPDTDSLVAAMWLISSCASVVAAVVLWRLVDVTRPGAAPGLTTLMFLAGPYSVFLYANYSESLFLAFALAAWYCAVTGRWWAAGMWCGFATFTRINGLFLLVGLIAMYLTSSRRPGARAGWSWMPVAASGVLAYSAYLAVRTGDLFAWRTAQLAGWDRSFHWPWESLYQTAGRVLFASTPDRRLQFGLDIAAAALMVVAVVVWVHRRRWPETAFAVATLVPLTSTFTLVSLARNSVTVFPLTILAAAAVQRLSRRWLQTGVLCVWFGLFLLNTTLFAMGYWAD